MIENKVNEKLDKVADVIASGVKTSWQDIRNDFPEDNFFAFALSTIDDAIYVSACANSFQNHQKICQINNLKPNSPEYEHYRWCACEWGEFEYIGTQVFQKVDTLLAEIYKECGDDDWGPYRDGIIESMIIGLARADAAGVFGTGDEREKIALFVTINDSFDTEKIEDESARRLNSTIVYEQFKNRYAATEKLKQDETNALQSRHDDLVKLGSQKHVERCLDDFKTHLINPLDDPIENYKREQQILSLMVKAGEPLISPMLEFMANEIETPVGGAGYGLMKVLEEIEPKLDTQLCHKLGKLLVLYCEHNIDSTKWQVTPYHIANFLHNHFGDKYPYPSMEGNNALRNYEVFLNIASID